MEEGVDCVFDSDYNIKNLQEINRIKFCFLKISIILYKQFSIMLQDIPNSKINLWREIKNL